MMISGRQSSKSGNVTEMAGSQQGDKRAAMREQIIAERGNIYKIFENILQKHTTRQFIDHLERQGQKQQIKSKNRQTETSIIQQSVFYNIVYKMTDVRLVATDEHVLKECL